MAGKLWLIVFEYFSREQMMPPDISQIESEIAQVHRFMEQQMRTMMGSFGFSFGNPFSGFAFEGRQFFWQFYFEI